MSLKRSHTSSRSSFGGDAGAKVDRQELFDELKRMVAANEAFTPVDVALSIGAGEPQVSKALLGLAAEGYLEKVETGKYRATGPRCCPDLARLRWRSSLRAPAPQRELAARGAAPHRCRAS